MICIKTEITILCVCACLRVDTHSAEDSCGREFMLQLKTLEKKKNKHYILFPIGKRGKKIEFNWSLQPISMDATCCRLIDCVLIRFP